MMTETTDLHMEMFIGWRGKADSILTWQGVPIEELGQPEAAHLIRIMYQQVYHEQSTSKELRDIIKQMAYSNNLREQDYLGNQR